MFSFSARYNQKPEANFKIVFFFCKGIKEKLLKKCIQMVVMIEKYFALTGYFWATAETNT